MKAKILEKLKEIENEHKIKILYACESGSRAWGFESPDSDFDIRFIYVNKLDYYLSIENKRDTIEVVDGELDFVGWDLKKALYLLRKSNPSLIEWLNSPIVYLKDEEFFNRFSDLMKKAFNIKALMYHYLHMAKTNYREYLKGDLVKIKKYFYVLRPILALKWLEDKRSIPPIEFNKLLNSVNIPEEIKKEILKLLEKKKVKKELDLEPRIEILNEFIEENISYYERYLKNLDVNIKPLEAKEFDDLLKEMIFKYDLEACYSLSKLKQELRKFVSEREWKKYHTLKNLAISVSIESAELLEHFQWWDKTPDELSDTEKKDISYELADIFTYMIHIAEKLGIDIIKATEEKLEKTKEKYPVEKYRGIYKKPK